jgi:hypothetical protein
MAATPADLRCLLCKKLHTDISASQWGVLPTGGYFDILYSILYVESGCLTDLCDEPAFVLTPTPEIEITQCDVEIVLVSEDACSQLTLT